LTAIGRSSDGRRGREDGKLSIRLTVRCLPLAARAAGSLGGVQGIRQLAEFLQ
jgi:hypothetical protein